MTTEYIFFAGHVNKCKTNEHAYKWIIWDLFPDMQIFTCNSLIFHTTLKVLYNKFYAAFLIVHYHHLFSIFLTENSKLFFRTIFIKSFHHHSPRAWRYAPVIKELFPEIIWSAKLPGERANALIIYR